MFTPMQTLLKQTGHVMQTGERLGLPLKWVRFPFVPACMADAGPTEWLKIFKTFA